MNKKQMEIAMLEKMNELKIRVNARYAKEREEDENRYNESAKRFKDSLVLFAKELAKKEKVEISSYWINRIVTPYECTDEYEPTSKCRYKELDDITKEYFDTMNKITEIGLRKREAQEILNKYLQK